MIQGIAEGFLARVIQHEVDHINGTLFIDLVPEGKLLPIEIYRKKRAEAIKNGREIPQD
jgi:peptide deformylase